MSGSEARPFLQGQLSHDVRRVSPKQSQLTTLNTPRGRTLALMRLFELDDALWLALPAELAEPIAKRLSMYVLRAKVEIETAAEQLVGLGIAGDKAFEALSASDIEPPQAVDRAVSQHGVIVIRIRAETGARFEIYGPKTSVAPLRDALSKTAERRDSALWRLEDTLAGVPLLGATTSGEFLPQMLNLDELDAISFQKGCYTGQEVIARAHYRGRVKRRLQLIFTDQPAVPGNTLNAPDDSSATVVQSVPCPPRGHAVLAVARVDAQEPAASRPADR